MAKEKHIAPLSTEEYRGTQPPWQMMNICGGGGCAIEAHHDGSQAGRRSPTTPLLPPHQLLSSTH